MISNRFEPKRKLDEKREKANKSLQRNTVSVIKWYLQLLVFVAVVVQDHTGFPTNITTRFVL